MITSDSRSHFIYIVRVSNGNKRATYAQNGMSTNLPITDTKEHKSEEGRTEISECRGVAIMTTKHSNKVWATRW